MTKVMLPLDICFDFADNNQLLGIGFENLDAAQSLTPTKEFFCGKKWRLTVNHLMIKDDWVQRQGFQCQAPNPFL